MSLVPVVGLWSHSLLKEHTTDSQVYVGGTKVKVLFSYNGRGIYSQVWCLTLVTLGLSLWLFNFPWLFEFYVCPFEFTLHSVTTNMAHNGDVAKTTHDTTRHDTADTYWLTVVSMLSCCATKLWMYSLCALSSPPHFIVLRVFNGLDLAWWFNASVPFSCCLIC